MTDDADKRAAHRLPVLKGAKAQFAHAVVDCLVLDVSEQGVRIGTDGFIAFPESFILELKSGSRWHATRRWQRGTEVGVALADFAGLCLEAAAAAAVCLGELRNSGLHELLAKLEQARFFDYPALKMAAERLEEAERELRAVIKQAAGLH